MIHEASFTGVIRTIFILIGVITVLRFLGKLMIAKREREKLNALNKQKDAVRNAKVVAEKNLGKVTIQQSDSTSNQDTIVDVNFEEMDSTN